MTFYQKRQIPPGTGRYYLYSGESHWDSAKKDSVINWTYLGPVDGYKYPKDEPKKKMKPLTYNIVYLTTEDIIQINYDATRTITEHEVLDEKALDLLVGHARQKEAFNEKAVVLFSGIIKMQPFKTLNNRTAVLVTDIFLRKNNRMFLVNEKKVTKFANRVIGDKLTNEEILEWFENNTGSYIEAEEYGVSLRPHMLGVKYFKGVTE